MVVFMIPFRLRNSTTDKCFLSKNSPLHRSPLRYTIQPVAFYDDYFLDHLCPYAAVVDDVPIVFIQNYNNFISEFIRQIVPLWQCNRGCSMTITIAEQFVQSHAL